MRFVFSRQNSIASRVVGVSDRAVDRAIDGVAAAADSQTAVRFMSFCLFLLSIDLIALKRRIFQTPRHRRRRCDAGCGAQVDDVIALLSFFVRRRLWRHLDGLLSPLFTSLYIARSMFSCKRSSDRV